jgi:hypothetical protein
MRGKLRGERGPQNASCNLEYLPSQSKAAACCSISGYALPGTADISPAPAAERDASQLFIVVIAI